jgi:hypothetical protein
MLQQARNLLTELDDRSRQMRFLIHDCNAKFPRAFEVLATTSSARPTPARSG